MNGENLIKFLQKEIKIVSISDIKKSLKLLINKIEYLIGKKEE